MLDEEAQERWRPLVREACFTDRLGRGSLTSVASLRAEASVSSADGGGFGAAMESAIWLLNLQHGEEGFLRNLDIATCFIRFLPSFAVPGACACE